MAEDESGRRRRQSGVLDAIFDAVEEKPEKQQAGASPFRASALARLDLPEQVDNLLPITSRRTWLAVVGVALVIVAFIAYAAVTTTVTAVTAQGRAVTAAGIGQSVSPEGGVITEVLVTEGMRVAAGDVIARGVDAAGGTLEIQAPVAGTIWQELVLSGGVVGPGTVVATVLPDGSDRSVLVALDETSAPSIAGAERIDLSVTGLGTLGGQVASMSTAPVPAETASTRTGLPASTTSMSTMVAIESSGPITPGSGVSVSFILSESTLLQSMLGMA